MRLLFFVGVLASQTSLAFAQSETRLVVVPSFVLGYQTADREYTSPHLNDYLAGLGWGGSLGILGQHQKTVFGAEISSVRLDKVISGRIIAVDADRNPVPVHATFQETFVSGVLGGSNASRTFQLLGGVGMTFGWPSTDSVPDERRSPEHFLVFTGGADWFVPISDSARLALGVRFSHVFREGRLQGLGVGGDIVRATVGVALGPK